MLNEKIWKLLPYPFSVTAYKEVDSTNTVARKAAADGAPEGTVILAEMQQGGRGRMDRVFFSPAGTGLYMSVVLRPAADTSPLYITTAAAVAVAESIEAVAGVQASIKWVNDIYCHGKKVCGILTEGAFDSSCSTLQYAILGIGINILEPPGGFPRELSARAGAVFGAKNPPPDYPRETLAADILTRFWGYYVRLSEKPHLSAYRTYSFLGGRTVEVLDITGKAAYEARVIGITDEFGLTVETPDGQCRVLSSGEVSLRL